MTAQNLMKARISIHALHEESDNDTTSGGLLDVISIHALHEESDQRRRYPAEYRAISIHALHEESDA